MERWKGEGEGARHGGCFFAMSPCSAVQAVEGCHPCVGGRLIMKAARWTHTMLAGGYKYARDEM